MKCNERTDGRDKKETKVIQNLVITKQQNNKKGKSRNCKKERDQEKTEEKEEGK